MVIPEQNLNGSILIINLKTEDKMHYIKVALLTFILSFSFSRSQEQQMVPRFSDGPAQYILGAGDVLTITVNLWGYVRKPGIFTIPSTYGLIDLISSAGGPAQNSRLNDVKIIRKDQAVITVDVEKFIKTGNKDLIPPLQPGDTIIVSGSIRNVLSEILGFARDIAVILNIFILYNSLNR